ncbi:putative nuclear RNA export factor SDE5 [Candidatus Saccharibacteria bacterium]|nr:putative nuclear RNA export factor SDE5 [Candidatus Saccharibacteria bacterium]
MRDRILDVLALEKQDKWQIREQKHEEYEELKQKTNRIYDMIEAAREEVNEARDILNKEFELLKVDHSNRSKVWDEYYEKRAEINDEITPLRAKADEQHRLMNECYDDAEQAYLSGDEELSTELLQKARQHRIKRNEFNTEVKEAVNRIRVAKKEAMLKAPPQDRYGFDRARERFNKAKQKLNDIKTQFDNAKRLKNDKYIELQDAETEFRVAKKAYDDRLNLIKWP